MGWDDLKQHVGDMVNNTPGRFRGMRRFRRSH